MRLCFPQHTDCRFRTDQFIKESQLLFEHSNITTHKYTDTAQLLNEGRQDRHGGTKYEGWNFNNGDYLFTTDTK